MCAMNAATSEPRNFSPSPRPTTSGESCRAPTTFWGSSACTARIVKVPSSRWATSRSAAVRSPVRAYARSRRCATTSVSVSERNRAPSSASSALSCAKFSTIPLWMTATFPATCGCALTSFGAPWVAHRVCPIAAVEA